MEDFGELITLETTTHPWVWWSLRLGRGLWDYKLFHLWLLVIFYSRKVLATLLHYGVVIIFIILIVIRTVVGWLYILGCSLSSK